MCKGDFDEEHSFNIAAGKGRKQKNHDAHRL